MAFSSITVADIEYVAKALASAAKNLSEVASKMKSENYPEMMLQLKSARGYAESCRKLGNDAILHLENQIECARSGQTPLWKMRQAKSEYNAILKANKNAGDPPAQKRKAAKKKP